MQCPGGNVPANVINSSIADYATGTTDISGELMLTVTDPVNDYEAGNFAGFRLSSDLLQLGIFSSISISTLLNGSQQELVASENLVVMNADIAGNEFELGLITTLSYDAVKITIDNELGMGTYNVYYATMTNFCAGADLECNTPTALNEPLFPVAIDYSNTGTSGVAIGAVLNPEFAISADTTDFANLVNYASIAGSTFISIEEQITDYPAGTFVGFDLQNTAIVGADFLSYVTITSYVNGVEQESFTGNELMIGASALNESGRQTIGFVTSTPVDEVKLTINQPAGFDLGTTQVYSAVFQEFCAGPALDCNSLTTTTLPEFPVFINGEHTGITGVACALCGVENSGNVIDADLSNWAEINIAAGVSASGSIAVQDQLALYPAGTFAGFHIQNPAMIEGDVLSGITITTYLDGVLQESHTGSSALITIGSEPLVASGEQIVGFVATETFDEVQISLANVAGSFEIGSTRVYGAVVEMFCSAVVECDTTYYLNNPAFPVYVDAFLTGIDGGACVGCEVTDEQNVITSDTSDYATIMIVAGALGDASIAVADALYTYPAGTFAGFVIDDEGLMTEAELFETLTISTYNNGVFQESRTGEDLIDMAVFVVFISDEEGRYNVGFETTMAFDEIRITVGSVAAAMNLVHVYSAFVDTRASEGGTLFCAGPVAVNDTTATEINVAIIINVLANDITAGFVFTGPVIVTEPGNGTVIVNADGSVTYTPDSLLIGIDTFAYVICDTIVPVDCDTALVIITVGPVNAPVAVDDEAYTNEDTPVTIDVLANDSDPDSPLRTPTIVNNALNGVAIVNPLDSTVLYIPDPGFVGVDSFTYSICDQSVPPLCDTATVIVYVSGSTDTVVYMIPPDELFELCVSAWIEFQTAVDTLVICGMPLHGTITIIDTCFNYIPDTGYLGLDTMCVVACDPDGVCDTNFVVALVELPLAVSWLSFEAFRSDAGVALRWLTSLETNNAGFEIERSGDGIHFTVIGAVEAGKDGHSIQGYNFTDRSPINGTNYYRIRQNDFDGKASYSALRTVYFNSGIFSSVAWPNPSSGNLTLNVMNASGPSLDVRVYNVAGEIVYQQFMEDVSNVTNVNIAIEETGIYMMLVSTENERSTHRIVVVK